MIIFKVRKWWRRVKLFLRMKFFIIKWWLYGYSVVLGIVFFFGIFVLCFLKWLYDEFYNKESVVFLGKFVGIFVYGF